MKPALILLILILYLLNIDIIVKIRNIFKFVIQLYFEQMKILIADSGSTKTEWKIIEDLEPRESSFSKGINPYFMNSHDITTMLENEAMVLKEHSYDAIFFYGTGCNSESKINTVEEALSGFMQSKTIETGTDLYGAARSLCQNSRGIACIMGTGSNSCYYDGKEIKANVSPLGYILGDEGGGAVLGRKLVSAVLKKQVPEEIRELFLETYKLTPQEILESVYMKPFPNRFLGQFAKFYSAHSEIPELREILKQSFNEFIIRNILQYPESAYLPVSFTGSIAFHFRKIVEESLEKHNLKPGIFTLSPMEGLVRYHIDKLKQF